MFIQSSFSKLDGSDLLIPLWNRAPLNLSDNTQVYVALLDGKEHAPAEVVITSFSPESWGDLWRLEFDVYERPGLLTQTFDLLTQRGIHVLTAETTTFDSGNQHTIAMVADCRWYKSTTDLTGEERMRLQRPQLKDLHTDLVVTLIKYLVFPDGATPRVRIRRIFSYYRCFQRLHSNALTSPVHLTVHQGRLTLPTKICMPIMRRLGVQSTDALQAMVLSDSKDRIMRVLFSTSNRGVVHIRIHFIYDPRVLARILAVIYDTQFDIVRSQLRQGLFRPPDSLHPEDISRYATLDLLLRTLLPDSEPLDTTLTTLIHKRLQNERDLNLYNIIVSLAEFYDTSV